MGTYIDIGNSGFQSARNGEYIDKSGLIGIINETLFTERRFSCVTRSRRFGKSLAAKMLCAYYDRSCQSAQLFADLEVTKCPSFEKHLNRYPVIYLDISDFSTRFSSDIMTHIQDEVKADIANAYPDIPVDESEDLMSFLIRIVKKTNSPFIVIIDEWDAICREYMAESEAMDKYVSWLRRLFKGSNTTQVFAGVYMTGILPVKKYKTESALNNFTEYSMIEPGPLAPYFGFTYDEVEALAKCHGMDFDDLTRWYDGYLIGRERSLFNPNSVMLAVYNQWCKSYWAQSGAFEAVAHYIQMNFEGLKDDIIKMISGGRCKVEPSGFQNDMSVIHSKDDVFTVLIHLGYLTFDRNTSECFIPNYEVAGEMINAVKSNRWKNVVDALEQSEYLLKATLNGDEETVAKCIDRVHDEQTSILSYNDENSLACVLSIAFYYARNDFFIYREFPTGKGFADLVFIPRRNRDFPAIIVELKYNKDVVAAIDQIHDRKYPERVADFSGDLLLIGINYDRKKKAHYCRIEKTTMNHI